MSASLTCSGCRNPNLTRDDFYWSKKEKNIKTQKKCKACVYKKRHPVQEKIFSIDAFKKYYAY